MTISLQISKLLILSFLLYLPSIQAQTDTLSTYHNLDSCRSVLSNEYPQQITRITPKRPGVLKQINLYLDGAPGTCILQLFGHEGGSYLPFLKKKIHPPIPIDKKKEGEELIVVSLSKEVLMENDQFFVVLKDFEGNFGGRQDTTFLPEFCESKDGGNYYPTYLLMQDSSDWLKENSPISMDIVMDVAPKEMPLLEDITVQAGLPLNLRSSSVAWADIDQDGWIDLLVGKKLFKNKEGHFVDISKRLKSSSRQQLRGACFIDMDNDGNQDILFLGTKKSSLYLNDGTGQWTLNKLSLPPFPALSAFSIADINKDGFPDIAITQLIEKYPIPSPNYLLLNDGQLGFKDVTKRLYRRHKKGYNFPYKKACMASEEKTHVPNRNKNKRSRAVQFTDIDMDGDSDLYITNYFLEEDELYINKGNGRFRKSKAPKPSGQSRKAFNHGTGIDWYDYDNDGDFDLLLPQLAHPWLVASKGHRGTTLFRNDKGQFTDITNQSGIHYEETHAGAAFGDLNNDGLVDLITTAYYGCRYVDVYLQQSDHSFKLNTIDSGLDRVNLNYDLCYVDYNNDGQLDVAIGGENRFHLYKNIAKPNNWVAIQLESTSRNKLAIGTIVKVYADGQVYTQEVNAGRGQRMQKPRTLHFGLAQVDKIEKVEIYWNSPEPKTYPGLEINTTHLLRE